MADWYTAQQIADHTKYTIRTVLDMARDGWFPGAINLDDSEKARFPTLDPIDPKIQKQKEADNADTNITNPRVKEASDNQIIAETNRKIAELNSATEKAKLETEALKAHFVAAEDYLKEVEKLKEDKAAFDLYKREEESRLALQAQQNNDKEAANNAKLIKLTAIDKGLKAREDRVKNSEDTLDSARKVVLEDEKFKKQADQLMKNNYCFLRNRVSRIANGLYDYDSIGDWIIKSLAKMDILAGVNGKEFVWKPENFEKVLESFPIVVDEAYKAINRLANNRKTEDISYKLVHIFDEIAENESFDLICPAGWIFDPETVDNNKDNHHKKEKEEEK